MLVGNFLPANKGVINTFMLGEKLNNLLVSLSTLLVWYSHIEKKLLYTLANKLTSL